MLEKDFQQGLWSLKGNEHRVESVKSSGNPQKCALVGGYPSPALGSAEHPENNGLRGVDVR